MASKDLVSIIIPVYNSEDSIERCVRSALAQSYKSIEVICVNDGSTDSSGKILSELAKQDQRVKVATRANGGVSVARNTGLDLSTGAFIMFLDSDDELSIRMVEDLLNDVSPEIDFVMEVGSEKLSSKLYDNVGHLMIWAVRRATLNSPGGKLYRRSLIQSNAIRFLEGVSLGEDLLFNAEFCHHISGYSLRPGRQYRVYEVDGSLTRSYRPTKYEELMAVHDRLNEVFSGFALVEMRDVLNYLRIKALISCASSLRHSTSGLSKRQVREELKNMHLENRGLSVTHGDITMRSLAIIYNLFGLSATERIVGIAKTLLKVGRSILRRP